MRTAVDTNVLLDILLPSPQFVVVSADALRRAVGEGSLVASEVVWAETRAHFPTAASFEKAMVTLGVVFDPCDQETAAAVGQGWREYRKAGGRRDALIADFLVAAHAQTRADRLLTRDRGFARRYFKRLSVLDPTQLKRK